MKKNIFLILILSLLLCACEGEVNQPIEEQPVLYYKTIKVVVVSNKKTTWYAGTRWYKQKIKVKSKEYNEVDENIRPYMKKKFLNRIELGILCCKDLNRQILYALGKCEKKTTYNYFKRHLSKFSAKTIGKNRILSSVEKEKLIRRKGITNPLPFIYCS